MSRGLRTREAMCVWGLIPPTKAALEEHVKRAAHQGGHVCVGSDTTNQGSSGGARPRGHPTREAMCGV